MTRLACELVAAAAFVATAAVGVRSQAPEGNLDRGRALYVKDGCAACHGLEGQGAPTSGPRIGPNPLPFAAFVRYVRAPRLQMPPYTAKVMPDRDLADVYAFLASRPKPAPVAALDDDSGRR